MEEWSVAGSGSEEDGEAAEPYLNFGGIRIPPERLLQLMQASASGCVNVHILGAKTASRVCNCYFIL